MSPKRKDKSFPPVKVTEAMLEETKRMAELHDQYLSDYIRRAVEFYNAYDHEYTVDSTHKNNTESNESICESIQKSINEDIHNGKYEGVKPYQPKSSMVKPLPKGGGKK